MSNAFAKLLGIQRDFYNANRIWKRTVDSLKASRNFNQSLEDVTINFGYDKITYEFALSTCFCRFAFANDTGVLLFGHEQNIDSKADKEIVTSKLYFDLRANVRRDFTNSGAPCCDLYSADFEDEFYAQILNALQQHFKCVRELGPKAIQCSQEENA